MKYLVTALCCGLIVLLSCPNSAKSDLDVTVPPGLPQDWMKLLPEPTLTNLGLVPRPPANREKSRGSVVVTPVEERPRYSGRSESALGFSGITTADLPTELPWSSPARTQLTRQPIARTGGSALRTPRLFSYPPPFPTHLYWLAQATFLRKPLHPSQVSQTQTLQHLIQLGHPAYLAAYNSRRESKVAPAAKYLIKNIGPLPRTTPRVLKHRDTYVHMLHRLALSELVSGYPYAPDRRFARRLLDLGHEALRPVLAHTDHPHRFVRRNAVAALGKFRSPTATSKLRQLLDDKDLVVRNRALAALVAQRDQGTVDWLLSRLRTRTNASLKVLAVDGLGRIGDKRALDAILSYTQAKHRGFLQPQPDGLWAAIPALGRLGKGDKRVLALLKRLETHCRRNKRLFSKDDTPSWSPVRRDTSTRAEVTAQMCRIARARLGDDAARKALLEEIKDGAQTAAKDPRRLQLAKMSPRRRRFFAGRLGGTRGIELAGIASVNLLLACEALGQMGTKGSQLLFRVVEDSTESAPVRTQALTGLRLDSLLGFLESIEKLGALALDADKPGLLRSRALWMLEDRDTASAIRVAQKIVGDYSASTPSYEALKKDWVVIPAMQLLGRLATIDVELLTQVVARATRERTEIARLKQQQFEGRNARYVQRGRYGRTMILTIPPVLEVAMLELGRTGRPDAAVTLNRVLDETAGEARPEAAISLGGIGNRGAIEKLVGLLSDTDKFVRFNAFRALRQLTDQNHLADWLFGSQQTRAAAIKKWKDWLKQTAPQTKQ